jgi:hypothetical protein
VKDIVPSADAGTDARFGATDSSDAAGEDRVALKDAEHADAETGDREQAAKKDALTALHFAARRKDLGLEAVQSVLVTAP